MLVATIRGPCFKDVQKQVEQALLYADVLEFRFDLFQRNSWKNIVLFSKKNSVPVLYTLRKKQRDMQSWKNQIIDLCTYSPAYFDVESLIGEDFFVYLHQRFPHISFVASYHDFQKFPGDWKNILALMPKRGVSIQKLACRISSPIQALELLQYLKDFSEKQIIIIPMGKKFSWARLMGKVLGNFFTYGSVEESETRFEGQLTLKEYVETYSYKLLDKNTKIYALLGNPVEQSIGHIFHNKIFREKKIQALYIKIALEKHELRPFLDFAKKFPLYGFSITMPFKEKIVPLIDIIDKNVSYNSVNTVVKEQNRYVGCNTDGKAALGLIENYMKVKNKKFVVFGSGGLAQAVVAEALKKKAEVILFCRNKEKAKFFKQKFGIAVFSITEMNFLKKGYDIFINATSIGMQKENAMHPLNYFFEKSLIFDCVLRKNTCLLKRSKKQRCKCIDGFSFFYAQGMAQQLFFKRRL